MIVRAEPGAIPVALRRSGPQQGVPVLAVHGFAADSSVWMLVEAALQRDVALGLIDLPGHGRAASAVPDALDGFGAHLAGAVAGQGAPVWLLAHSFGAAVALRAAALVPGHVAGLILIAPAGLGGAVDPGFIAALLAARDAAEMRAGLGQMLSRPAMITHAMAESVLAQMNHPERGPALRAVAALLPGLDAALAPHLPALAPLPIHVISGAADRIIPPPAALPACWPDARHHVIDGAGHLPQLEAARPTITTIRTALGLA
ncbi:MAG: alpha/beta fold hydrolase [Rhodobacteraceae bacterium]|nr:alpha/beta fold hydrolase [Paracoccaceae bacterium]